MENIILVITLIVSLFSLALQFHNRKLSRLEEENKRLKEQLLSALKAIHGYHKYISKVAVSEEKNVQSLKKEIHQEFKDDFTSTSFVQPGHIQELISKYS
jgi:hypothetical protein